MSSIFKKYFDSHPEFHLDDGLYIQKSLSGEFEDHYIQLRQKEGRVYEDAFVAKLPDIPVGHPLYSEWKIRRQSADRLVHYLKDKIHFKTLLEVGCGNGWLTHYLSTQLHLECSGIDINKTELMQATRVFANQPRLTFSYADILSSSFEDPMTDCIVLASSTQYFENLPALLFKLLMILNVGGEIHILDSPFYHEHEIIQAKQRSDKHFLAHGDPQMRNFYHHHNWKDIHLFHHQLLYNPRSLWCRLKKMVARDSPFPWIVIKAYSASVE